MTKSIALLLALAGCYLHHYPITPSIASQATYKMYGQAGQGTAWAVSEHELVTAGHMCDDGSPDYVMVGLTRRFHASPIVWERSEDHKHDLCVLHTSAHLDEHLVISDRMPVAGEQIGYVGYPAGNYTSQVGTYVGDTDGPDRHYNDYVFAMPAVGGASGSALYLKNGGVWGVLVRCQVNKAEDECEDRNQTGAAVPLADVRRLLDEARVKYDLPPLAPEELPE